MTATGQPRILVVVAEMGHVSQREIVGVTRFAKRSAGLSGTDSLDSLQ